MANIFYAGEKAEKSEASQRLIEAVSAIYDGEFGVIFQMDDGGTHLTLLLEVESPGLAIDHQIENMLLLDMIKEPKWMGWRFVTLKIPPGGLCLYDNQE
tara:strand:- start:203 stop:499 length:297 start_codon:yes stop_codon:yes gene_type:complete